MMEGGGGGGNSQALQRLEQESKQLQDKLKQTETKMRMKAQQEHELGKVIKHLEEKCLEEQYKSNQAQEEIKRLQNQYQVTQENLARTEVKLAEQSKSGSIESELKYRKLEERFTNMKSKARAKISEKDDEIQELTKKSTREGEMLKSVTADYQETLVKLSEKEKKVE